MTLDYLDCIGIYVLVHLKQIGKSVREATEYFTQLRISHIINHKNIEAVDYA